MANVETSKLGSLFLLACALFLAAAAYSQTPGSTPPTGSGATDPKTSQQKQQQQSQQQQQQSQQPPQQQNPQQHQQQQSQPQQQQAPAPPVEANVIGILVREASSERPKRVALGDFVVLTFDRPWADILAQQKSPTNKLGLYINDLFMKGLEPMPVAEPNSKSVMFQLKRNDDNRPAWSVLFGHKSFGRPSPGEACAADERITLTVGLQDGSWAAKSDQTLCLKYFPDWKSWILLLIAILVACGTVVLGKKSAMLRDSGDPRTDGKPGTYSLGRCQMALWFVTILFASLFTFGVTGDMSPIPQGCLILMGIGAGTALGSAAIDLNKRTATKTDLTNWTAEKASLPQQISDLQNKIAATPPGDQGLPGLNQQLVTAQQRLVTVTAQLAQISSTEVAASQGLILDILSDENGISFHRLQMAGWTFVFWALFVSALFRTITLTDFDTTQLALIGISGSTYLGFKLQE